MVAAHLISQQTQHVAALQQTTDKGTKQNSWEQTTGPFTHRVSENLKNALGMSQNY